MEEAMNSVPATVAIPGYLPGTWKVDPVRSGIAFSARHLRSAGYPEVEKYPAMSHRSASIHQTDDRWVIDGELTMHGVTRQVPLAAGVNGFGPDLPRTGSRAGSQVPRCE
jgi:polyisoprenoid-binding protein YceI